MALTDARAIHPGLSVGTANLEADARALTQLALWCQYYTPLTRADPPDGLCLDLTGCIALFGSEEDLLSALIQRLARGGLTARAALAPTLGAAWALARYGQNPKETITNNQLTESLANLPVAALRLELPTVTALHKVGLKQIGDLLGRPRAPLTARFGPHLLQRLDEALGKTEESLNSTEAPTAYHTTCRFAEPITALPAIEKAIQHLIHSLTLSLAQDGKGTSHLELKLFQPDNTVQALSTRTSSLTRDAAHLAHLLTQRLDKLSDTGGFGFEAARLAALTAEPLHEDQNTLNTELGGQTIAGDTVCLIDRLMGRFGPQSVTHFVPHASYLPERAFTLRAAAGQKPLSSSPIVHSPTLAPMARPLLLFHRPEPVTALFEIPDGPPIRFKWRRVSHHIARADGPERIAPEWWRPEAATRAQTRDYFRIETTDGRRFWLFREGLFERPGDTPAWFVHGLFP